jgi:hypothetical protein
MSDKSPLFVSAIELLAHATELYTHGNERKYKFVILHLANAIELILKDRLVDKGVSIYVQKKFLTVSIWEACDQLIKVEVDIPERPVIELLIDDRNTIQHRFGFPDATTVYYYLEKTVSFFKRFLDEEYNVELVNILNPYLSEEDLAIIGLIKEEKDEYTSLDKLFELSPDSAVLQAFNLVESKFTSVMGIDFPQLLDDLVIAGFISHDAPQNFEFLRDMRNQFAHTTARSAGDDPSDWAKALKIAKDLLSGLDNASQSDFFTKHDAGKSSHDGEKEKTENHGVSNEQ